ncbi:MAG: 50S ribosomal protein L24 [bacterium]|nr:50S ribosomal protein L24 [bacterium]
MKLKKGDTILVSLGRDKGKKGKIERVFTKDHAVLVGGINVHKRHMKRRDEKNPGGIIEAPSPIQISKVSLLCPSCNKPTRVGFMIVKDEKIRICKKCHQKI